MSIRVPKRGDKRRLLETVEQNAREAMARHKLKRASDLNARSAALEELRRALGLPIAPLRIECYDISNLQSTEIVASMVVFEDGLPRKSEYRRFTIRQAGPERRRGDAPGHPAPAGAAPACERSRAARGR